MVDSETNRVERAFKIGILRSSEAQGPKNPGLVLSSIVIQLARHQNGCGSTNGDSVTRCPPRLLECDNPGYSLLEWSTVPDLQGWPLLTFPWYCSLSLPPGILARRLP